MWTNLIAAAAFLICLASPATTTASDRWSLKVETAAFYDSNLVVEEADIATKADDVAVKLAASVDFKAVETAVFDLNLGYDFGQTLYSEFEEFNLQTHRASIGATQRVGKARIGLNADFTHVKLGGDPLLNIQSVSPVFSAFIDNDLFLRAFYRHSYKDFHRIDRRDANVDQVGAAIFRFHDDRKGYVAANVRYENEDADDPSLDFEGISVGLDVKFSLEQVTEGMSGKVRANYRKRDYADVTLSIGEKREENRYRGEIGLSLPLSSQIDAEANYRLTDRNSNFPSADYVEHRAEIGFVLRL